MPRVVDRGYVGPLRKSRLPAALVHLLWALLLRKIDLAKSKGRIPLETLVAPSAPPQRLRVLLLFLQALGAWVRLSSRVLQHSQHNRNPQAFRASWGVRVEVKADAA